MLPNYVLLLIEPPQTKLGLDVSEVRVTGQMGEVYEAGSAGGVPATHKAAGKCRKFTHLQSTRYLEGAIHRKWDVMNTHKLVGTRKRTLGKCISTGWKSLSTDSHQHGIYRQVVTAAGKSFRSSYRVSR